MTRYLGDGVYATCTNGCDVWLDCRNQAYLGIGPSGQPSICLEPAVLAALNEFVKEVNDKSSSNEELAT